jgi:hypothetical protein
MSQWKFNYLLDGNSDSAIRHLVTLSRFNFSLMIQSSPFPHSLKGILIHVP